MNCKNCEEHQVEYSNKIGQLRKEIAFMQERYQLTADRKSVLMRDWLKSVSTIRLLRCQLRGLGHEPTK